MSSEEFSNLEIIDIVGIDLTFFFFFQMIMHLWLFIVLFSSVPSEMGLSAHASYRDDETSNQNNNFVQEDKVYK